MAYSEFDPFFAAIGKANPTAYQEHNAIALLTILRATSLSRRSLLGGMLRNMVGPLAARRRSTLVTSIDTLYSEAYMDESTYLELMKRARNDLAIGVERRRGLLASLEATEKEIAQLKRLIGGIYAYADRIDEHNELCAGEGLKEAICTALRATSDDVTISEILAILKDLQFPIERHQNPLGSVYTTVTRLMAEGEIVAGAPKGEKKTYRWAKPELSLKSYFPVVSREMREMGEQMRELLAPLAKDKSKRSR